MGSSKWTCVISERWRSKTSRSPWFSSEMRLQFRQQADGEYEGVPSPALVAGRGQKSTGGDVGIDYP